MHVAIAGCGWTGALLSRLLTEHAKVDVYEQNKKPTAICACGIPTDFFVDLAKICGLNPEDYILWEAKELIINFKHRNLHLQVGNLCTFDKQKFMEDLVRQSSATFRFGQKFPKNKMCRYDIVIDATGTRALLGKLPTDQYYVTYQVKARFSSLPYNDFYFRFSNPKEKYLWLFPLSEKEAYVGCASKNGNYALQQVENFLKIHNVKTLQRQAKLLRLTPPQESLPFTIGRIVGVGNSIGAITSLGEGNAPSAITAQILIENLNNPEKYAEQVLKELAWLKHDHAAYNAWAKNQKIRAFYHMLKLRKIYRERFKASFDIRLLWLTY